MHIPWEDLEVLVAIAEEKSFSAAARRLSLTQPTVSRRVSALEERLGAVLFVRDVEGARLTDEGARLLPAAKQMARFAAEAEHAATQPAEASGRVELGYQSDEASEVVLWLAARTREALPEVTLRATPSTREQLKSGAVDLFLGGPLKEDEDILALGKLTAERSGYATRGYLRRLERKGDRSKPMAIEWLSPRASEQTGAFLTGDHHLRVRAAEMGLGAVVLPRALAAGLTEIPRAEREFAPLEVHLAANRAACLLSSVRAVAALFTHAPHSAKDMVVTPAKGSPFADLSKNKRS